jgi:sulfide:quinone oxidoreductase
MQIRRISDRFSVSPQIAVGEVADIAAMGFRGIVCNRPDGEGRGQPSHDEIAAVAAAAGLEFRYVPAVPGRVTEADVAKFAAAIDEMPGPVLGYCASGARSAHLWNLAEAGRPRPDGAPEEKRGWRRLFG